MGERSYSTRAANAFVEAYRKTHQGDTVETLLVTGKPVMLVLARGGEYPAGSPAAAYDHQRPHLELLLGFMGFSDIRAAVIEPTLAGPDKAEASLAAAVASLTSAAEGF
jgi:FMN-dependent NADH-azoreductase